MLCFDGHFENEFCFYLLLKCFAEQQQQPLKFLTFYLPSA